MCLNAGDCTHAHDVISAAPARKIVYRIRKTLRDRAICLRLGEPLHEFVSDVSGIKIGKDQDIRFAGHS